LKLKGKGHEFSDAARLLLFYQMWLDDLFPKAKFLDALSLVEKAGHKKRVISARMEVINEGRPRTTVEEDDLSMEASVAVGASENDNSAREDRPQTPSRDAVPDEEDLYGATPRNVRQNMANEDDLDALIAEAEGQDNHTRLLGRMDDDEDDLDALIAEAETTGQPKAQRRLVTETAADQDFADEEAAMLEMDGAW
jgi:replication fork protection complex subunit Csm3/Swi3